MRHRSHLPALCLLLGLLQAPALPASDIDSLMRTMSLREKIAQIIFEDVDTQSSEAVQQRLERWVDCGLGGLIVMDGDAPSYMAAIDRLQSRARIPLMVSIAGEWGASMRFWEYAAFPRAMQMGALDDCSLVEAAGRAIGEELAALKIFVNFAPVVDVNNNPANPVINTRSFGEDPRKVALFGAAFVRGMQGAGVSGAAKHFPGHGDTDVDSHKGLPTLPFDRARLDSVELRPFRELV